MLDSHTLPIAPLKATMHLDLDVRAQLKARGHALIEAATEQFDRNAITRAEWQEQVAAVLAEAYLADDDPRWQSGFDGDEALWREARSLVLLAASASGTFLDVGCANGYLLQSLARWAPERGQDLELYGLELNASLAAAARLRLPQLAASIFTGNISDWHPPRRFDCVRVGLEYVPHGEEVTLLDRIARDLLSENGRVLVGPVNDDAVAATRCAFDEAGLSNWEVVSQTDHRGKTRHVVWCSRHLRRITGFVSQTEAGK